MFRRDNHYVPRAYLKRWECSPGTVWTYRILVSRRAVPEWKQASIRGIAYREHLYTRIAASGESDEIEHWLDKEFESPAEEAIDRAISGRQLRPADWRRLVRFFAAQDVRTPARLVDNLQRWSTTLPEVINEALRTTVERLEHGATEPDESPLAVPAQGDPLPFRVSIERTPELDGGFIKAETIAGRGLWLWSLRHVLTSTLRELYRHRWTILSPPDGTEWLTSDDPVLRVNFNSLSDYTFTGGWGSAGTDLLLPLGPRHLLYTQVDRPVPPRGSVMAADKTTVVRQLVAEHAHRFVFATVPDPFVARARPRVVDAALLRSEADQWRRWHDEQTVAERALLGGSQREPNG